MTPETNITEHAAALLDEAKWELRPAFEIARRNMYIRTSYLPPATGSPGGQASPSTFDQAVETLQYLSAEMSRLHTEHEARVEFRRRYLDPMKVS